MTTVNVFLTDNQRNFLTDSYLNQLTKLGYTDLLEDAYDSLVHMKNPEFYNECLEFMPDCMNELRTYEIR